TLSAAWLLVDRIRAANDARRNRKLPWTQVGDRESALFAFPGSRADPSSGTRGKASRPWSAQADHRSGRLSAQHGRSAPQPIFGQAPFWFNSATSSPYPALTSVNARPMIAAEN